MCIWLSMRACFWMHGEPTSMKKKETNSIVLFHCLTWVVAFCFCFLFFVFCFFVCFTYFSLLARHQQNSFCICLHTHMYLLSRAFRICAYVDRRCSWSHKRPATRFTMWSNFPIPCHRTRHILRTTTRPSLLPPWYGHHRVPCRWQDRRSHYMKVLPSPLWCKGKLAWAKVQMGDD